MCTRPPSIAVSSQTAPYDTFLFRSAARPYVEAKLLALTRIPPPTVPPIKHDPAVANKSLRVIAAVEAGEEKNAGAGENATPGSVFTAQLNGSLRHHNMNKAAIERAMAEPRSYKIENLFQNLIGAGPVMAT